MESRQFSCPEEEIHSLYQNKQATQEEYFLTTAMLCAQKAHLHAPVFVPVMPEDLSAYIKTRKERSRERNESFHRDLAAWIFNYSNQVEENKKRIETLSWAKSLCAKSNLQNEVETINQMLNRFSKIRFENKEKLETALVVLGMDMREAK